MDRLGGGRVYCRTPQKPAISEPLSRVEQRAYFLKMIRISPITVVTTEMLWPCGGGGTGGVPTSPAKVVTDKARIRTKAAACFIESPTK